MVNKPLTDDNANKEEPLRNYTIFKPIVINTETITENSYQFFMCNVRSPLSALYEVVFHLYGGFPMVQKQRCENGLYPFTPLLKPFYTVFHTPCFLAHGECRLSEPILTGRSSHRNTLRFWHWPDKLEHCKP
uniref:Uncharacterized protein n=1 Tax=Sphaerodactylus townsendi TaxID=933632 RepID=A0ACB8FGU7_9SAUR